MGYNKEKVAYLRGVVDGMDLGNDKYGKLFKLIVDTLDEIADTVDENEEAIIDMDECIDDICDELSDIDECLDGLCECCDCSSCDDDDDCDCDCCSQYSRRNYCGTSRLLLNRIKKEGTLLYLHFIRFRTNRCINGIPCITAIHQ